MTSEVHFTSKIIRFSAGQLGPCVPRAVGGDGGGQPRRRIALFTLPLLALAVGATAGGVAAVTAALTLAWLLFGLYAGWLVDRLPRRALLVTVNLVRAGVLIALAALYANGGLGMVTVLVAALLLGVAETLAAVVVRPHTTPSARVAPPTGVGAGLRHLWRQPVLSALTLFTAAMNVVWAAWTALFVVYAVRPGPLDLTPAQYGFLLTAMAVGGLLASTTVDVLRRGFGVGPLLVADAAGTVLLVAPAAVGAPLWAVAAGAVVAGSGPASDASSSRRSGKT
ncbi:MAG TPA: hypothetical protein VK585_04775 [Jiangellaceae bacterium]|nr:hypothetical protein [Jiangellaceae bacterium]